MHCISLLFPWSAANTKNYIQLELLNKERWLIKNCPLFQEGFVLFSWDLSCWFVGVPLYIVCHIIWAMNRWRESWMDLPQHILL